MDTKLIIAISSRALFNLDTSNTLYETQGVAAYSKYQVEHETDILEPGVAFPLVKKLLNLNKYGEHVEVILLSRNSADTGLRIFNSIKHHNLDITRAVFTSGLSTHKYAKAFKSHLFLSTNHFDVKEALESGCAAATILPSITIPNDREQLRIAFDGDAVLFSDEAEQIYHKNGLEAFARNEQNSALKPLPYGPLQGFLAKLHSLQRQLPYENCPIRTALVTARSAPAHERVIRTFRQWGIRIDEALFLGGMDKAEFLNAFGADFFFDDQEGYCLSASQHVATGHVPHGIKNRS
ncbi:MAG: 5'-nucleotidase [Gammaproteobacteria bacterium]|nr:5'-nucleotidase [Gammaproteobacteria bacterium]